jgi:hypothetical protein
MADINPCRAGSEKRKAVAGFDQSVAVWNQDARVPTDRYENGSIRPWDVLHALRGDGRRPDDGNLEERRSGL